MVNGQRSKAKGQRSKVKKRSERSKVKCCRCPGSGQSEPRGPWRLFRSTRGSVVKSLPGRGTGT
eukprot:261650-Rhodomonas_salina.1